MANHELITELSKMLDKAWTDLHNESIELEEVDAILRERYDPEEFPLAFHGQLRIIEMLIEQDHDSEV